jgi:hypothetical protein
MKNRENSTASSIEGYIMQHGPGEPFATSELLGYGSRASIDQTLSRMAKQGTLERVTPGVYVQPRVSKYVGKVKLTPMQVAGAVARSSGSVLEVHGAEAAREFGLTTQVPVQPIFSTSGRSREIKYGEETIVLRHTSQRRLLFAGRPAGRAFSALLYLGKSEVNAEVLQSVRRRLPEGEFELLASARSKMPAWLSDVFNSYQSDYDSMAAVA